MVVFVDFGEESGNDDPHEPTIATDPVRQLPHQLACRDRKKTLAVAGHRHPVDTLVKNTTNKNTRLFARALACYPIASSIASDLDLNALHALSLTCSLFRRTLLPFRLQLVTQTLRCSNEITVCPCGSPSDNTAHDAPALLLARGDHRLAWDSVIKAGPCARDMVGGCRRCGTVVCRNCTAKPLNGRFIKDRVRRLCTTCAEISLQWHLSPVTRFSALLSSDSVSVGFQSAFTSSAFARDPCTCEETVWLCHTCGGSLHSADVTYKRVWTWRSRYSTHIGGLGTGMGEGDQGQKCGKGPGCAEASEIEVEIDCSAEGDRSLGEGMDGYGEAVGLGGTRGGFSGNSRVEATGAGREGLQEGEKIESYRSETNSRMVEGPGYLSQEIEGIGGVVKKKVKKRVRVGATVQEFEDERESGRYLEREEKGLLRCWCGWCDRVVPMSGELKGT